MEIVDPLSNISSLSLFPKTLTKTLPLNNNNSEHDFLLNMELKNPEKYHHQAKQTLEMLNQDLNKENEELNKENEELNNENEELNNENEELNNEEIGEVIRERRPGLGRKKAKFLINTRQSPLSLEPIKYAELSKDPKEFFAYFERREMAEKELRRLRGESVNEAIDFDLPIPERRRRLGLLRKTATYKHSSTPSQNHDTIMPLQEEDTSVPDEKESHVEVKQNLTEPVSSKISTLVDELLHSKDLYADEVSALVLERLQIESSITTDEIPIPVFRDSKSRPVLSNVQNLPQIMTGGKALAKDKQVPTRLSLSLAFSHSPTSPFASISAFQKHIQHANRSEDRFAGLNLSPPRNPSFQEEVDVDEQSNHFGTGKEFMASSSRELKMVVPEGDDDTVHNLVSSEMITDGKALLYDKSVKDQLSRSEASNNMSVRTDTDFGVDVGNEFVKNIQVDDAVLSTQIDANLGSSSGLHTDFQTAGLNENDENLETMSRNAEPFINDDLTAERTKSRVTSKKRTKSRGHKADYKSPAAEVIPVHHSQNMEEPSEARLKNADKREAPLRKGHQRKKAKGPVEASQNDQTQAERPHKKRKTKEFSRRNSLAAAGTHWVEGTRKSNRIKVKPLEFWRGERLLYARVHESLPTVIGLRYDSPEKGSKHGYEKKRNLKVESYVHGGEYEELVKQRALY